MEPKSGELAPKGFIWNRLFGIYIVFWDFVVKNKLYWYELSTGMGKPGSTLILLELYFVIKII